MRLDHKLSQGWRIAKLGEVVKILNGYAFKSANYVSDGVRVIRITNVQKGLIVDDNPKFYSHDSIEPVDNFKLFENDLLISLTGNVGRVGLLPKEYLPAALNQRVACVRVTSEKLDKKFLYYFLNRYEFEYECILSAHGVAQKNMSTVWLGRFEIPLPPLSTQKKIVAILDAADTLRQKRCEADEKMKDLIPAIFVKMFGDPATNPMGWKVKKLGEVCCREKQKIIPKDHPEKTFRYIGLEHIESGTGELAKDNFQRGNEIKSAKGVFRKNQILYGRLRPNLNKVWLTDGSGICSTDIWVLSITENVSLQYLFRYLLLDQTAKRLSALVEGINLPRVNVRKFDDLEILVPPLPLQLEFVEQLDHLQMHMQKSKNEDLLLHSLFDSFMHKAFRGELVT